MIIILQGHSQFHVKIIHRITNGGILCHIFLAEDKSLAFKFDKDSREVMIDTFNASSKNSFQFVLSLAEVFPNVNFVENF